jgi:hypothetical protein
VTFSPHAEGNPVAAASVALFLLTTTPFEITEFVQHPLLPWVFFRAGSGLLAMRLNRVFGLRLLVTMLLALGRTVSFLPGTLAAHENLL